MGEDSNASLNLEGNGGTGSNEGGNVATLPTFAEQLDGSLRSDPEISQWLSGYKDKKLSDLVKDHYNVSKEHKTLGETLAQMKGEVEGRVKVPGKDATQEDIAAFKKAMGVPDTVDGYKVERPKDLPKGMQYDEQLEKTFLDTAHTLGLTPAQVAGIFEMYNAREVGLYNGIEKIIMENRANSEQSLKNIWQNSYEENKTKTVRTFFDTIKKLNPPSAFGGAEGIEKAFTESGFGDNPAMVWYFNKLFDVINIDSLSGGSPSASVTTDGEPKLEFSSMK